MMSNDQRSRIQAGVPEGGQFAAEAKGENPDLPDTPRFSCHGYTSEPLPLKIGMPLKRPGGVEIGSFLANLDADERQSLLDGLVPIQTYDSVIAIGGGDHYFSPEARRRMAEEGVAARSMYLTPNRAALEAFFAEHPAWSDGCGFAHPTGGYFYKETGTYFEAYYDEGGERHREDGPAEIERPRPLVGHHVGTQTWMTHGEKNRAGGHPAVMRTDGSREWWVDGRKVAEFTILGPHDDELLME